MPRWMSCGRAAMIAWIVLLLWSVSSVAQSVPAVSTPPAPHASCALVRCTAVPCAHADFGEGWRRCSQAGADSKGSSNGGEAVAKTAEPTTTVWQWKGLHRRQDRV